MPRIVLVLVALLAVAAGWFVYNATQQPAPEVAPVPVTAPQPIPDKVEFELSDLDGNTRSFSEWGGKHRIVNFWATWCAPCRREIPLLKAFQEQHGADDFQVIGIAVEFLEPVVAYAAQAEFNYPILYGEQDAMAVAETSGISFVGLPFTMIVAKDGTLIGAHMGEIHQRHLDAIVDLLGELDRGEVDIATARSQLVTVTD